ncbi:MAG: rhodanese-like domain-containing protein [bacterium]|nr:rhodanese-like domain-containing protein [bacterium]
MLAPALLVLAGCTGRSAKPELPRRISKVRPAVAFEIQRDSPDIFILDLRRPQDFDGPLGHIEGAVNIPLAELAGRLAGLRGQGRTAFLVYCHDDACGEEGMRLLKAHGFPYGFLIEGGLEAWIAAGFESVQTTPPAP